MNNTAKIAFRNPKLRKCDMKKCHGYCCYDGVYLRDGEEDKIKQLIKANPQDFNMPAEKYFMDGNWKNRVSGRKTAVQPFKYPADFPKHFEQTKCVFSDDDGLCILQKIALRENKHPWTYKPFACCIFPLVERGGKLVPPPNKGEKDDCYTDEYYTGFVNALYCGQDCNDGEDWQKVLKEEIEYFKKNTLK